MNEEKIGNFREISSPSVKMKRLIFTTAKYVVADGDTVEKIAARFDCTPSQLMKLNKLHSRVLFCGQSIFVPDGETVVEDDASSNTSMSEHADYRKKSQESRTADTVPAAPAVVPPPVPSEEVAAELDAECVQKFLKLNTYQVTKGDGDIPGILIITPNCVMFDPDPTHPAVTENGQDKYGMVAPVDVVVSIGLYEGGSPQPAPAGELEDSTLVSRRERARTTSEDYWAVLENDDVSGLPDITAPFVPPTAPPPDDFDRRRRASTSDLTLDQNQIKILQQFSSKPPSPAPTFKEQRRATMSFVKSAGPVRKLSGFLKKRDKSVDVLMENGEKNEISSVKRKLSAGKPETSSADVVVHQLEFNDKWYLTNPPTQELDHTDRHSDDILSKQKENYEIFALLKRKTEELRKNLTYFYKYGKTDRSGCLGTFQFPFVHDLSIPTSYYLKIYLDDRRRKKEITKNAGLYDFGDKNRNEFVFFVPAEKIDFLYLLFLQWSGEKNENDPQKSPDEPAGQNFYSKTSAEEFGFVVIDDPNQRHLLKNEKEHEENLQTELNLNFRWEIVSIFEIKHRLSLSEITEASFLPLPDGTDKSTILNELMIRRIVSFLPARAQGYPWVLIYSSEVHGFSLGTMYRNMVRWKDEMSPTLLVIKDTNHRVFGAICNCVFRISDHFYGSGESLLFAIYPELHVYRWTGVNNFIIKGNPDSLAIGAGQGTFGLYLDADFYHGRTQHCETFDNEPLTSSEDFIISGVEAFGFSMTF